MDFLEGEFDYETLTTTNIFESVYKVEIHLHHSHVTGRSYCYDHDFCNIKVRQN